MHHINPSITPATKQTSITLRAGLLAIAVFATTGLSIGESRADGNSTYPAMYFHSQVQDAPECSANANAAGLIGFPGGINSPAATCPDAFGWKQFLDAIADEFWDNWGNDETVWVSDPKPICSMDRTTDCCFSKQAGTPLVGYRDKEGNVVRPEDIGGPGKYCPYIPGDYGGATETTFAGGKPGTSHNSTFLRELDPARVARQGEVEIVYRNSPFIAYTTAQELYSKPGLAKIFARASGEAKNSIPYRPNGQSISYPTQSVMFKADWIAQKAMLELGYIRDHDNDSTTPPQNPDTPYITMKIKSSADKGKTYTESLFYLAAITGASKALPNWHWYAFEHEGNLGRCDYTGCNDSFGFKTTVTIKAAVQGDSKKPVMTTFESNFITPLTQDDQLKDDSNLFVLGKAYPSGKMTDALKGLFTNTGIGNGENAVNPDVPQISDPAWQSYRLKGTQTQFYNNDGYPTIMGASITEGGFVNTASCMSCHVQASVNAQGENGAPGVGSTGRLNLFGIGTVVEGAPSSSDFYDRGTTNQRAARIDYVWGILNALSPEDSAAKK